MLTEFTVRGDTQTSSNFKSITEVTCGGSKNTFKKIPFVSCPSPDVHEGVYALSWDSVPAAEDVHGVPVACPVVLIFIKPVPAVAEKVRAKSHRHFSTLVSLFADPVKCSIKRAFT